MFKRSWLLFPLLALAACNGDAPPPRVVEPRAFAGNAPRDPAAMQRAMLTMHNATRASVRQLPLRWDSRLAADARAYAAELARSGRFEHSSQGSRPGQGENLWTGTRGAYRYDEMAGHWIEEQRFFVNRPSPGFSTTGDYRAVGHYTQIIWSGTVAVGCGFASGRKDDFLVCRYSPPGNVIGQRALP